MRHVTIPSQCGTCGSVELNPKCGVCRSLSFDKPPVVPPPGADNSDACAVAFGVQRRDNAPDGKHSDTALLDFLESQGEPGLRWVFRKSNLGRVHVEQTLIGERPGRKSYATAREALTHAMLPKEPRVLPFRRRGCPDAEGCEAGCVGSCSSADPSPGPHRFSSALSPDDAA